MSDAELMAAVNAGISQANGPSGGTDNAVSTPSNADSARPDDDTSTDVGGDEGAGTGADDTGHVGDDGGAGEGGGEDTPADADAEPSGSEDKDAESDKPADEVGAAEAQKPADGDAKPADPLNDPLPNALKKETKDRIKTLVSMVKDKTAAFERVNAEHQEVMGYIRETRATPEQYGQALTYLKLVNSPDRADKEAALEIMQQEIAVLARMIGKPVPGVNMLEGHDDLIAEVGAGRLSMERAAELAAAREERNFKQRQTQATRQTQEETNALAKARQTAVAQLNAMEMSLRSDPSFAAKRPILIAQLKPIFARVHPSHWPTMFKQAYDALPTPQPAPQPRPNVPNNTPLRAANPAGNSAPAPKSMAEAIEQGLKNAR